CRTTTFSNDGKKFAWCDMKKVHIMDMITGDIIVSLDQPRTYAMYFSPDADLLCTWEQYTVSKTVPAGTPNFNIWKVADGSCVYSAINKKVNGWRPDWLNGTSVCGKLVGHSVHFFTGNDFQNVENPIHKLSIEKLEVFEVSPNPKPPHKIACFIRGSRGGPASVRIFEFPKFNTEDVLAHKSFFKADTVTIRWNNRGTELLVTAAVDVDTTGESYYGEQSLHYMSCSGETAIVQLPKKGPIYDAAWSPISNQFCAVFGFMPAKACLFNSKCQKLFEFGPTPKNECYFNPHGNLLILAGFGNLRGNIEVWDCSRNSQVNQFTAPDTTYLEWCSDGEHFVTATTAPRLRVNNGYKLWNYTGGLLQTINIPNELNGVCWQPTPAGTYPAPLVKLVASKSLSTQISASKPASYVPPHARGKPSSAAAKFKLDDEDEQPVTQEPLSKSAQKNKKKREGKKNKKPMDSGLSAEQRDVVQMAKYLLNDSAAQPTQSTSQISEDDKKIKNLRKKLQAIEKLKKQLNDGKQLEKNQLEKLSSENLIIEELAKLGISV
uniref:Eukaryotic translation initiation factor 2A n=1 Tax=Ciona savignyi TaxID=51511 RepID=H2YIG9_CIOSA